jgi:hypothetical protein
MGTATRDPSRRFMGSPQSQEMVAHWDHEPLLTKLCCICNKVLHIRMTWFMESPDPQKLRADEDLEPIWEDQPTANPVRWTAIRGSSQPYMESHRFRFKVVSMSLVGPEWRGCLKTRKSENIALQNSIWRVLTRWSGRFDGPKMSFETASGIRPYQEDTVPDGQSVYPSVQRKS